MEGKRAVVPLALIAVVFSALFRASSTGGAAAHAQTAASRPSETSTANDSGVGSQPGDEPIDSIDVLGESLGADVSTEGLKKRAMRAVGWLRPDSTSTPEEREAAVAYLRCLFDLPIRRTAPRLAEAKAAVNVLTNLFARTPASAASRPFPSQSAVDEVERFLAAYFNQDALRLEHPEDEAKLLAGDFERLDKTSLTLAALHQEADAQRSVVHFMVATLPDPIDSYTGWQFDPMLDAIVQAIAGSDYVLDRSHLSDSDVENGSHPSTAIRLRRVHEEEPGVVLFRKHIESGAATQELERLVLLIVHENPSAGVHTRALVNAIKVIVRWGAWDTAGKDRDRIVSDEPHHLVRILGPTFSGSSDSIGRAVWLARQEVPVPVEYRIHMVTGSATDTSNEPTLKRWIPDVVFRATVNGDDALFRTLDEHMTRLGWFGDSSPMAVLFEANTQYGRGLRKLITRRSDSATEKRAETIELPFSMNVSRLRSTIEPDKAGTPDTLGLPSRFRPLSMEEMGHPADRLHEFFPVTTSAYVELMLAKTLQTIRQEHVGTVALMATDSRDKLFLAQQLARYSPNVSIVTAESDSLYVHPDYSSFLRGALVVSTYPMYNGNQRWSYGFEGRSRRREFANGSAQGIYNAALVLLNYNVEDGTLLDPKGDSGGEEPPPTLIEYGLPGQPCDDGCAPPVWLSVVGRDGVWPIRAYAVVDDSHHVFAVKPSEPKTGIQERSLATFPSPVFNVLFLVLTSAIVACWTLTVRPPRLDRKRGAPGLGSVKGRVYILACIASVFLIETFVATLALTRFRIERSIPSGVSLAAVVVCLAALVDLGRRALVPMVKRGRVALPRRTHLKRISTWAGLALATIGAWGVSGLLGYEWQRAVEPWQRAIDRSPQAAEPPSDAISFLARAVDVGSGVSPLLPVLFLGSALTLWGLVELARCRRPKVALANAAVQPLVQQTINGDLEEFKGRLAMFDRSILAVPAGLLIIAVLAAVATGILSFDSVVAPLVTIEGGSFGRFVWAALLIVQTMIALSLLQIVFLWSGLKRLLQRMARHHLADAYDRVPRELSPIGLFPRVPALMELQIPVAHWQRLVNAARLTPAGTAGIPAGCLNLMQVFQDEMRTAPTTAWSASRTWSALINAASHTAAELQVGWKSGVARRHRVPETAPFGVGLESGHVLLSSPIAVGPIDHLESPPAVNDREDVVAMSMALVIRDAIARLGDNVVFVTVGVILVLCSHTLFPFQAHQRLEQLAWTYIGLTFAAVLTVAVQMRRNEIIARLMSTTPGETTTWDGEFVLKLVVFVLLPLLTLFATQFPDVGGMLLRWLEPVEKALP